MNRKNILKIFFALIILFITLFLFKMSGEDAAESTSTSAAVIKWFLTVFRRDFVDLPFDEQEAIIALNQHFFRKAAHFSIYFVLGLSVFSELKLYGLKKLYGCFGTAAVCLIYAFFDEFHQLFVDGRSGQLSDVLLDFSGGLCGMFSVMIILLILEKRLNGKQKE